MKTQYVLSLSYGKDSLACLGAIEELDWHLDRILHAEIWATDTVLADFPEMVEFKQKADAIIKERYGITVEHFCAMQKDGTKQTYENIFYHIPVRKPGGKYEQGTPAGFPFTKGAWCNDRLKTNPLDAISARRPTVKYLGIAADEPERLARLDGITRVSPLSAINWTEADAREWCVKNDLLSPIYTNSTRGGGVLVLSQSRSRPTAFVAKKSPRIVGLTYEMGFGFPCAVSRRWTYSA